MIIQIYTKPGCGICEYAKDKLIKLGLAYEERNLEYHTQYHEGWREDGSVEAMAAHLFFDSLPLFKIDGEFYTYRCAMCILRKKQEEKECKCRCKQ